MNGATLAARFIAGLAAVSVVGGLSVAVANSKPLKSVEDHAERPKIADRLTPSSCAPMGTRDDECSETSVIVSLGDNGMSSVVSRWVR